MGRRARMVRFAGAIASITAIVGAGLVATPVPSGATDGSHTESMESAPGQWSVLRDGFDDANTSVPAPADGGVRAAQATFQVNYSGFPTDARIAFQAAVDIWASYVASPVPIVIDASWTPLPTGILGRADATVVLRNFSGGQAGTWYPSALANALHQADLLPTDSDIDAEFASNRTNWYFGTDGHPPAGTSDFETTVLHEIGHGLGFSGSMAVGPTGVGSWGTVLGHAGTGSPSIYDVFARNGSGAGLLTYPNSSMSLGAQLVSNDVYFSGPYANAANGGSPIKLFAPSTWDPASSFSHFDEATYLPGDQNSLMTPGLDRAESIHDPGPDALGVLHDLGWQIAAPVHHPVQRIFGQDAIGTSLATSQAQFGAKSANAAVLARSDHFADALAGGPLAALQNAPLLITPGASIRDTLDPRVLTEIQRVLPAGKTVFILGGPLALAPGIDAALQAQGYTVVRVQGANQYATAVAIAGQLGNPNTVFEATGLHFADSLSAVPAAIQAHGAILLTSGNVQAPETAAYLTAHPSAVRYAIGGPLAAAGADPGATAVWGQDLFATSAAVAQRFFANATTFGAATGFDFPDALSGSVFMGSPNHLGPMLLVTPHLPVPPSIAEYLARATRITNGYVFGGPLAVGDDVAGAL